MKQIIVLILLLFFFYQPTFAQIPTDEKLSKIRADLQTKIEKKELASVAIGVLKHGKVVWKETLGWADRENGVKATSQTIYPLASLSKSITATGLWVLVEQGKLVVNDEVEKHLKSVQLQYFQGKPDELKIKHLLNMEGGVPHQFEYFYDADKEQIPSLKEQIQRYGFVAFPPGKTHTYSNFSYGILDQIITDVSGRNFADFMSQEVFKPLGMTKTFVDKPDNSQVAKGYDTNGNLLPVSVFTPRGGAGMYSTLDDLLAYGSAHLSHHKLLKKETLEQIHQSNPNAPNPYYSSGWGVLATSDGRVSLLSNGSIAGTATTLLIIPKENLVIVCVTNTSVGNEFSDRTAFQIAGALLDGYSESLDKLFAEVETIFTEKPFVADESYFGQWTGNIKTNQGDFSISLNFKPSGEISVSFNNQNEEIFKNPQFEKARLKGRFIGTIPIKEAQKKSHQISLELMKVGNKMFGTATAQSNSSKPKFYMPFYVELIKN